MAWTPFYGEKVICVDDDPLDGCRWVPGEEVVAGHIYTALDCWISDITGEVNCALLEVCRAPLSLSMGHNGYAVYRFRPLEKRKTSLEAFRLLLNTVPAREVEGV